MQKELKQSGAKDTGSFNQRIKLSLLTLTLIYVSLLAFILLVSSSVTYALFSGRLDHRFSKYHPSQSSSIQTTINNTDTNTVSRVTSHDSTIKIIDGPKEILIENIPPNPEDVRSDLIDTLIRVNGMLLLIAGITSYFLAKLTLEPLNAAYARQRRFLSDASHELRTPLSIMHMDLENQLSADASPTAPIEKKLSEDIRKQSESNLEEVKRMSGMVNDLLILSRLDEERMSDEDQNFVHTKKTSVDLIQLVSQTTNRLQAVAKKYDVTLKDNTDTFAASHGLSLFSNEHLLSQSLINLVKNAIVYNKPSGSVIIELSSNKHYAFINVIDTGIGIAQADVNKIFDRFYRVDKSRSRQTGGSGLGLSIVHSAIRHLGGKIAVKSKVGEGTTIAIELPLRG